MSLPRFTCLSKFADPIRSISISGQTSARIVRFSSPITRYSYKSQASRFFSATALPKPLLESARSSLQSVSSHTQAKRFYNGRQRPYKFPTKTPPPGAQEPQEPQQPHKAQPLGSGTPLIGGIIATCASLFLWVSIEETQYRANPNKKSRNLLESYNKNFVLSQRNINEGRYWTLITSAFSHNSITHIAFNMLALWSFAPGIVAFYGLPTFGIVYFGSAVAGSMAQLWWWDRSPSKTPRSAAGASGAIFGLTGFMACGMPFVRVGLLFIPVAIPIRIATAGIVALSIAALKEGWANQYGHAAHLGGLVFGALWWAIALRKGRGGPKMW